MKFRPLNENDAETFQKLRFKALKEFPEAFGTSFEDKEATDRVSV